MQRITGPTVVLNKFGTGKSGFTNGAPGVTAATVVDDDWLDAVQEEIANAVEGSGQILDTPRTQLKGALDMVAAKSAIVNHDTRSPSGGSGGDLRSVAEGELGTLIAVGGTTANIQRSTNLGAGWVNVAAGGGYTGALSHVSVEGFVWLAVGAGIQWSADDGVTWENKTPAGGASGFTAGVYGYNNSGVSRYVIVGTGGKIQTSDADPYAAVSPTTWTARTPAGGFANSFNCAAFDYTAVVGAQKFLIAGDNAEIQTSPDGITWTQRTPAGGFSASFLGAVWTGTMFILCGYGGEIQTSPDGITWTQRATGAAAELTSIAVLLPGQREPNDTQAFQLYVAVGSNGEILLSKDTKSWISCRRQRFATRLNSVANGIGSGRTFLSGRATMVGNSTIIRQSQVL